MTHHAEPSAAAVDFLKRCLRDVPDFPKPGILFKDITPLLADRRALNLTLDLLFHRFLGEGVDAIVGIESRGFIFGSALAARLQAAFVPVRKPGKLPFRTNKVSYDLEYGQAELEMHVDALEPGARVVIVDDLLATGGTALAARQLVAGLGAEIFAYAFVVELRFLGGRKRLQEHGGQVISLVPID